MKRWLPAPWLSLLLLLVWLLLNGSLSAGQITLGLLFALRIPLALRAYLPDTLRLRRPGVLLRLLNVVMLDIVLSNLTVARQILGREAALNSRFVWVPLDLREPAGIAALASIITMTPGTLSCDLTADRRHLLVHALHVADEAALIATIKARYETPLREILEC